MTKNSNNNDNKKKQRRMIMWLTVLIIIATTFSAYAYKEYKRKALYEDTIDFFYENREEFEKAIEYCNEINVSGIINYNSDSSLRREKCGNYYIYFKKEEDNAGVDYTVEDLSKLLRLLEKNELISITSHYSYNEEHIDSCVFFYKGIFKHTSVFVVYTGYPSTLSVYSGVIEPDKVTVIDDDWIIFEKEHDNNPQN